MLAYSYFVFYKNFKISKKLFSQKAIEKLIEKSLKALNCETKWTDEDEDRLVSFQYQSGFFRIRIEKNSPYIRLSYLFFFNTPLDNVNLVRNLCNQCNLNSLTARIFYTIDEEKNAIDMHIAAGLLVDYYQERNLLAQTMRDFFSWQNAFIKRFNEMLAPSAEAEDMDEEKSGAEWRRKVFLVREQELKHQQQTISIREDSDNAVTLQLFMDRAMDMADFAPSSLTIITDKIEKITDAKAIKGFKLNSLLFDDAAEKSFVRKEATLNLSFFDPKMPEKKRYITFYVQSANAAERTLYYRITATLMPLSLQKQHPSGSNEVKPAVNSVLVAFDIDYSAKKKLDEFNFMWAEAKDKLNKGDFKSMTDEQQLICECMIQHTAFNLFRGRQLYLGGRYLEALQYLENAFNDMQSDFDNMKNEAKAKFFEVCYMIGFCYCELHVYAKGYYYLDMLLALHNIGYTEEYINCIVNNNDFRALTVINGMMLQLADNETDDEGNPMEHIAAFNNFLKRRKAYVYIEKNRFDDAESLLKQMLNEPDNSDFAINELAYIQKIRKK
jgi:hypothetical protein